MAKKKQPNKICMVRFVLTQLTKEKIPEPLAGVVLTHINVIVAEENGAEPESLGRCFAVDQSCLFFFKNSPSFEETFQLS